MKKGLSLFSSFLHFSILNLLRPHLLVQTKLLIFTLDIFFLYSCTGNYPQNCERDGNRVKELRQERNVNYMLP